MQSACPVSAAYGLNSCESSDWLQVDVTAAAPDAVSEPAVWDKPVEVQAKGHQAAEAISAAVAVLGWGAPADVTGELHGETVRAKPHKVGDKTLAALLELQRRDGKIKVSPKASIIVRHNLHVQRT